ncbi:MAG TPA: phage holin family protein [Candidatus Baltobacteraceae bacterium]
MHFLIRFIVNAIVLYLIINYVPGFVNGSGVPHQFSVTTAIVLVIVFGLVNAFIGPVLRLLSSPITWLTHGAFSVVINWIVFGLAVWLMPDIKGGWAPTLIGAVIMMIVSTLLQQIWKADAERAPA